MVVNAVKSRPLSTSPVVFFGVLQLTVRCRGKGLNLNGQATKSAAAALGHKRFLEKVMYAIIKSGGKQHRVQEGTTLRVAMTSRSVDPL